MKKEKRILIIILILLFNCLIVLADDVTWSNEQTFDNRG